MTVVQENLTDATSCVWVCDACGQRNPSPMPMEHLIWAGWQVHNVLSVTHHTCPNCSEAA